MQEKSLADKLDEFNNKAWAFTLRLLLVAWLAGLTYLGIQLKGQLDRQEEMLLKHDQLIGQQADSLDSFATWAKEVTGFLQTK